MGSPTKCFAEARKFLPPDVMANLETRAAMLRGEGMPAAEAARAAVLEAQTDTAARLAEVEKATAAGKQMVDQEPAAAPPVDQMDAIRAQFPDLQVQLDGMDAPMRMDDFLASVKAEADDLMADAPLLQVAAECALLNGIG